MNNWDKVWSNNAIDKTLSLHDILVHSGFAEAGITEQSWVDYVDKIAKKLNISKDCSVFEFGCGCGGFILPLLNYTNRISGVDICSSFIENCRNIHPAGNFQCIDFLTMPVLEKYDIVCSNSVFQYIDSDEKAIKTINKMVDLLADGGTIALLDINNADYEDIYHRARAEFKKMSMDDYHEYYKGLNHKFYDKILFENYAQQNKMSIEMTEQNISGNMNNQFRFNVFMKKI